MPLGYLGIAGAALAFMMLAALAWFLLLVWALVDMLTAKNDPTWKILWLLVILMVPLVGVILYFLIGKEQKKVKSK